MGNWRHRTLTGRASSGSVCDTHGAGGLTVSSRHWNWITAALALIVLEYWDQGEQLSQHFEQRTFPCIQGAVALELPFGYAIPKFISLQIHYKFLFLNYKALLLRCRNGVCQCYDYSSFWVEVSQLYFWSIILSFRHSSASFLLCM